jgi:hypothetical protein
MKFLHKSTNVAGFYRNSDSAKVEAIAIKVDAARGPTRPAVSARELRRRRRQDAQSQRQTTLITG